MTIMCNICGGNLFKEGPLGRKSLTGKLPACVNCGSLERHRLIRRVWNCIPVETLHQKQVLQFSMEPTVEEKWFGGIEVSIYGYRNTLDLQEIERDDGSYDIVICNHVLEHVKKDRQAFREILRILRPTGFLQFSVPNPKLHAETKDWGYPKPDLHEHYRMYGRDLLLRFSEAQAGAHILEVDATDEVTGVSDFVYFASLDESWIDAMQVWFNEFPMKRGTGVRPE